VALVVSSILLIFVVPQFESVFKNFGAELPAFTQVIVNMSRFMVRWWFLIFVSVVGVIVGLIVLYKR